MFHEIPHRFKHGHEDQRDHGFRKGFLQIDEQLGLRKNHGKRQEQGERQAGHQRKSAQQIG